MWPTKHETSAICPLQKMFLTLLPAKSLQSCPTLCDPIDSSPPSSLSLGFSRQEHWSGLPFPSPMHEREKWKWSRSVVSNPQRPHGLQPSRLLHPCDFPGKSTGVGCHCLHYSYLKLLISWRMCSFVHKSYLNVSFFMCSYTIIWYSQANFLWIIIN